jgi:hypothetical protein
MEQEDGRCGFRAGLTVKDFVAVDGSVLILDHDESPYDVAGWPGLSRLKFNPELSFSIRFANR